MKHAPATRRPCHPARALPRWIASSVELGPGIRFVAPTKSKNSCSSIHLRRATTSVRIIAICAAGPPKAMVPSFRKSCASLHSSRPSFSISTWLAIPDRFQNAFFFDGWSPHILRQKLLDTRLSRQLAKLRLRTMKTFQTASERTFSETQRYKKESARLLYLALSSAVVTVCLLALRICVGAAVDLCALGRFPSFANQLGKFEEVHSILAVQSPFCYGYTGGVVG